MSFGRVWRVALVPGPAVTVTAKQLAGAMYKRAAYSALPFDVTEAPFVAAATPEGSTKMPAANRSCRRSPGAG